MKNFAVILSLALSVACSAVFAEEPAGASAKAEGAFSHDGLYVSNAIGFGYSKFKNDDEENSIIANGFGFSVSHKIGYAVCPDLILHANLLTVFYSHLEMRRDNVSLYAEHIPNLRSVRLGLGATYYLTEFGNMFVGGSAGVVGYLLDLPKMSGSTGPQGFGFSFEVGREFWVSENWGLGVAFVYNSASLNDRVDGIFNSSSMHLMLTATFN